MSQRKVLDRLIWQLRRGIFTDVVYPPLVRPPLDALFMIRSFWSAASH